MAYMSQEHKKRLAPKIKAIFKEYGLTAGIGVRHHSELVVTIRKGPVDFIGDYNKTCKKNHRGPFEWHDVEVEKGHIQVNHYHHENHFSPKVSEIFAKLVKAMKGPEYFDESDSMTDYFHCSHYFNINVGQWDRPYELVK